MLSATLREQQVGFAVLLFNSLIQFDLDFELNLTTCLIFFRANEALKKILPPGFKDPNWSLIKDESVRKLH